METIVRGNVAEAAFLKACAAAGLAVFLPFGGGTPVDCVVLPPSGAAIRVQVKCGRVRGACVAFNTHATDHGRGALDYRGRADVLVAYARELDELFVVAVADCPQRMALLRLAPTRNNQSRGVRLAADHTFDRWVASLS